jgi:hypothetical protein
MPDDSLTKQSKLAEDIGVRYSRMISHSVEVMAVADRAFLAVGTDGKLAQPPGTSDSDFVIMQHALLPTKHVPFYLLAHRDRVHLAHRIAGDRSAAPPQLAKYVVKGLEKQERSYPVIDVKVKDD